MEFKGTKEKWELQLFNGKGGVIDVYVDNEIDEYLVAQVYQLQKTSYNEPFNEELKANALLISKSPILLKAIKESIPKLREAGLNEIADYHEKLYIECVTL